MMIQRNDMKPESGLPRQSAPGQKHMVMLFHQYGFSAPPQDHAFSSGMDQRYSGQVLMRTLRQRSPFVSIFLRSFVDISIGT